MRWQALLTLALSVLFNAALFVVVYLVLLAVSALLIPANFPFPMRVLVFVHLLSASGLSWWIWKRIARFLQEHLDPEWTPDWDGLVKRLTGRF